MKKNIKFGVWEKNEVDVEHNIMILHFSTNYGFVPENDCFVTTIDGKKWKMCYIGSNVNDYLKFEVKPHLKDDVSYNTFLKAVNDAGHDWRTSISVLQLLENITFYGGSIGIPNFIEYGEPLIGLIPVNYKFDVDVKSVWNDYLGEYDIIKIKKAIPA